MNVNQHRIVRFSVNQMWNIRNRGITSPFRVADRDVETEPPLVQKQCKVPGADERHLTKFNAPNIHTCR
jgi:hypothetical protein